MLKKLDNSDEFNEFKKSYVSSLDFKMNSLEAVQKYKNPYKNGFFCGKKYKVKRDIKKILV